MRWERLCQSKEKGGLNFRKLREFNVAMLAKQAWRIITEPNLLVSRIYKQKYFPRNSFLDAPDKSNISFCWRSLLATRQVLRFGMAWRVGNGENINLWTDHWLPGNQPYIQSPVVPGFENAKVKLLLANDGGHWNEQMLSVLLSNEDQQLVRKLPIAFQAQEDVAYWRMELSGALSVKSCYYTMLSLSDTNDLPSNFSSPAWNNIWSIKGPPRVHSFLWKVATKSLPALLRLRQRYVDVDVFCPICREAVEDEFHALVTCSYAYTVWDSVLSRDGR